MNKSCSRKIIINEFKLKLIITFNNLKHNIYLKHELMKANQENYRGFLRHNRSNTKILDFLMFLKIIFMNF